MKASPTIALTAASTSSLVASGRPKAMLSATVPLNTKLSCVTMATTVLSCCSVSSGSGTPSTRTLPSTGS